MESEEIVKLQNENFVVEKEKSQLQEQIYDINAKIALKQKRQQEINTRLTEILHDSYKLQTTSQKLGNSLMIPTGVKADGKTFKVK